MVEILKWGQGKMDLNGLAVHGRKYIKLLLGVVGSGRPDPIPATSLPSSGKPPERGQGSEKP